MVSITAWEPHALAENCKFLLAPPLFPGRTLGFSSAAEAAGDPLFSRIFAIRGVKAVAAEHDTLLLWRDRSVEWTPIMEAVRWVIRDHCLENTPVVPASTAESQEQREARIRAIVEDVLANHVNPAISAHEGRIVLLDVRDTIVHVEMQGGCQGCGMSWFTLKKGLVSAVRARAPDVRAIHDTTDHAAGTNPYYAKSETPTAT